MEKKFDKKIKQKINQTEISPSAGLWSKIEAGLPPEEKKKGFFLIPLLATPIFKQAIAASVMFLLGGMSVYYFVNTDNATQQIVEQNAEKDSNLNTEAKSNLNEKTTEKTNNTLKTSEKLAKNTAQQTNTNNFIKAKNTNNSQGNTDNNNPAFLATNNSKTQVSFNPLINNNDIEEKTTTQNMRASDYSWIYDSNTGTYSVELKSYTSPKVNKNNGISFFAEEKPILEKNQENQTGHMSMINKKEKEKL